MSVSISAPSFAATGSPTSAERFAALWQSYHPAVLAYAIRRAGGDVAADVATATFAVLWRRIDDPPTEPLPWLYAVARRELANQRRGEQRRRALLTRLKSRGAGRDVAGDAAEGATDSIQAAAALMRLSDDDREVLMLLAWEGLDPSAAATALGITPSALAVRLHRARRRLESQLTIPKEHQS